MSKPLCSIPHPGDLSYLLRALSSPRHLASRSLNPPAFAPRSAFAPAYPGAETTNGFLIDVASEIRLGRLLCSSIMGYAGRCSEYN